MPGNRGLRQVVGISKNAELMIMIALGVMRNVMNWFSFSWAKNIQQIWNLPGPEPSFSFKYNIDYWIKNILSLVLLFRNFTTHLHLVFYIIMLYPVITGRRPRLMLPWLCLQMLKNIVTDLICTGAGVILCLTLHSCGSLTLEFLAVQLISTMPSIYLWRRLRSHYLDLYHAELDAAYFDPRTTKPPHGLTLAQRRRAAKSLEGGVAMMSSANSRTSGISSSIYEEFFGPVDWDEDDSVDKVSKSLTTLLSVESGESDDVEERNSRLEIIDDANLTPAEKTLKILGLTRDSIGRKTSTPELGESSINEESKIQNRPRSGSKSAESIEFSHSQKRLKTRNSRKCECCEGIKCSGENDNDSDEDRGSKNRICCDQNHKRNEKLDSTGNPGAQKQNPPHVADSTTVSTTSGYHRNNLYPSSRLQAVVERDGIVWDNLKKINFVSVINKSLCSKLKPFESKDTLRRILQKDIGENYRSFRSDKGIITDRENGTKSTGKPDEIPKTEIQQLTWLNSASFEIAAAENTSEESYPRGSAGKFSLKASGAKQNLEGRELKEMKALQAYNEKTLFKYKKEMEKMKNSVGKRDKLRSPYPKLNCLHAPSVPELEKRDNELVSDVESPYGRFTRSKPSHRRKESSCGVEVSYKTGMRKPYSKYSKLTSEEVTEFDVRPAESCKRIEGPQKGRDLDKLSVKENIRARNVEVYFLERQLDDKPSTSKNGTLTASKSSSQRNKSDFNSADSSGVRNPEITTNSAGIPCEKQVARNVKEAVRNIDWSLQGTFRDRDKEKKCESLLPAEMARGDSSLDSQDIVLKSTEDILKSIFSHGENCERGFRLGESANEFYPIFNTVNFAIKEIVRAAGLRGFRDDFLSQPSTEIEIPYGSQCEITRSSSREPLDFAILSENSNSGNGVTTSATAVLQDKKQGTVRRKKDSLDRDETTSFIDDDETSDLLSKLVTNAEPKWAAINIPVIGPEDVPEKPEDNSNYFRVTNSQLVGVEEKKILPDSTGTIPGLKVDELQFELDVAPCKRILNHVSARENEMQRIVAEFFNKFTNPTDSRCPIPQMSDNSGGAETVESEETEPGSAENSSSTQDGGSESTTTRAGISGTINFQNIGLRSGNIVQKRDRENEEDDFERRVNVDDIDKRSSRPNNVDELLDEKNEFLLNIPEENSPPLTNSEILNRDNFRHNLISSAFAEAIKHSKLSNQVTQVDSKFFAENYEDFNEIKSRNTTSATVDPDAMLRNIETAECAIKKLKNLFEDLFAINENRPKKMGTHDYKRYKMASFANSKSPIDWELKKLQNLIEIVTNYVTISGCSSGISIRSFNAVVEPDDPQIDFNFRSGIERENDFGGVAVGTLSKNSVVPRSNSSQTTLRRSTGSKTRLDSFCSWEKVIPTSPKRLIAKSERSNKPKKVTTARGPIRKTIKVTKLIEEENSDFLSARSVPQRGRGLSSGYLMDSDSDGNFTVSRPPTPDSIESETSLNSSCANDQSQVFSNPPQTMEILPRSDTTLDPSTTGRPPAIRRSSPPDTRGKLKKHTEEYHVLGIESLSTGSDLSYMTSLDAAGIEIKLKDVVHQILNHKFSGGGPLTNNLQVVSDDTSSASMTGHNCEKNVQEEGKDEDTYRNRIKEILSKPEDTSTECLVAHYRDLDAKSVHSHGFPIEVLPRNSKVSLKHVAIETEYSVEVFKELLEIFGKICPMESGTASDLQDLIGLEITPNPSRLVTAIDRSFQYSAIGAGTAPNITTTSYDSFESSFSQNLPKVSKPTAGQDTSISNDTFFEEFPDQFDETSRKSVSVSISEEEIHEESSRDGISVSNSEKSDCPIGSTKSDNEAKKNSTSRKKAIPRPVKRTKERKSTNNEK